MGYFHLKVSQIDSILIIQNLYFLLSRHFCSNCEWLLNSIVSINFTFDLNPKSSAEAFLTGFQTNKCLIVLDILIDFFYEFRWVFFDEMKLWQRLPLILV